MQNSTSEQQHQNNATWSVSASWHMLHCVPGGTSMDGTALVDSGSVLPLRHSSVSGWGVRAHRHTCIVFVLCAFYCELVSLEACSQRPVSDWVVRQLVERCSLALSLCFGAVSDNSAYPSSPVGLLQHIPLAPSYWAAHPQGLVLPKVLPRGLAGSFRV